jgi:hypothetical protein
LRYAIDDFSHEPHRNEDHRKSNRGSNGIKDCRVSKLYSRYEFSDWIRSLLSPVQEVQNPNVEPASAKAANYAPSYEDVVRAAH